jgi:Helix-turn-helix domain
MHARARSWGRFVANGLVGMCWLIDFPTPPMRLVMMKICDCADDDGTNIFPSVDTIHRETGLGASTIRAAIAAFEECGLLIVKANKFGNCAGKTTTVRELDTDKLRLVTGKRRKGQRPLPSTHVLRRAAVEVPAGAETVMVAGAVLPSFVDPRSEPRAAELMAIFVREAGDECLAITPPADGEAPLQDVEGHPSTTRTPPLQQMEVTPPGGGPNPSLDPL